MPRTITRALIGKEDLLLGVGSVSQERNGSSIPITKINAGEIPFEGNVAGVDLYSIKDVISAPLKYGSYDFDTDGGVVGDIALLEIPDNSTITRSWYEIIIPFTSAGLATVALGIASDDTEGLVEAVDFDNAMFTAGYHGTNANNDPNNFTTKTTAKRNVVLTIGTANLTAGKLYLWCEYVTSE